jgi:hypothetical protein
LDLVSRRRFSHPLTIAGDPNPDSDTSSVRGEMMNARSIRRFRSWILVAGIVGGALTTLTVTTAWAPPSTQTSETNTAAGQTRAQIAYVSARIESIHDGARNTTLEQEDSDETTINIPRNIRAFGRLELGDRVDDVDYYESLAISMLSSGAKPTMTEETARSVDIGGTVMGREVTRSAEVTSVDAGANTGTFKGPQGHVKTVRVADPTLQQKLATLKPGQFVQLTYTQATAAAIRPSK